MKRWWVFLVAGLCLATAVIEAGAGTKNWKAGVSGGVIDLHGTITADGGTASQYQGPGAGGSIYLVCRRLSGSATGVLSADGGDRLTWGGVDSAGGGGRIAVWRTWDVTGGTVTGRVAGGLCAGGSQAEDGTIVWGWIPPEGTVIAVK